MDKRKRPLEIDSLEVKLDAAAKSVNFPRLYLDTRSEMPNTPRWLVRRSAHVRILQVGNQPLVSTGHKIAVKWYTGRQNGLIVTAPSLRCVSST